MTIETLNCILLFTFWICLFVFRFVYLLVVICGGVLILLDVCELARLHLCLFGYLMFVVLMIAFSCLLMVQLCLLRLFDKLFVWVCWLFCVGRWLMFWDLLVGCLWFMFCGYYVDLVWFSYCWIGYLIVLDWFWFCLFVMMCGCFCICLWYVLFDLDVCCFIRLLFPFRVA